MKPDTLIPYKSHRTTVAERVEWVERFRQSRLSRRDFAAQHGVGFSTLSRWLRQAKRSELKPAAPRVQEVPLQAILGGSSSWAAEVVLKDGTTVRLGQAVAGPLLQRWLGRRPC